MKYLAYKKGTVLCTNPKGIMAVLVTDDRDVVELMDEISHSHDELTVMLDALVGFMHVYHVIVVTDANVEEVLGNELVEWFKWKEEEKRAG